ncbi:MAG: glycosyltransferase family 2 protein [Oscillochloridaceae bacterium]|nr:glycosyltransferase family 2 protein [Chloroflexaceae bacterium]MDW8389023.1 glycosyltransferase family 2 protein [Oscillochloridaceae bacterium]
MVSTTFHPYPTLLGVSEDARSPIHTTVLIPVYNEEAALPRVLEEVLASVGPGYEILVIDDGSRDGTVAIAQRYPCRIISHETNRGKGAAMRTGLAYARGEKVIFIDGDATYPASAIPEISRQLDHYDLVRCVRQEGRDKIPFVNRLGNLFFDHLIRSVHQVEGNDVLSGLYGLHRRHLLAMRLESDGFDIETEIMVKAGLLALKTHSMPIQYHERIGEKKLKPLRDGWAILLRVLRLAAIFNPFVTYILPGLLLWLLAFAALLILRHGPSGFSGGAPTLHAMIFSAMAFLTGFQLVMLGGVVHLYTTHYGMRRPNRILDLLTRQPVRLATYGFAGLLILAGSLWTLGLAVQWVSGAPGGFYSSEALIVALAMVVGGTKLFATTLLMALFASHSASKQREQDQRSVAVRFPGVEATH